MKTLANDDAAPEYKLGAAIDARAQHKKYWGTHAAVTQTRAATLRELAHKAYGMLGSKVYMNARDRFITIKVDKPSLRAQWLYPTELAAMHAFVVAHNIEPVATKNNLTFRIAR